MIFSFGFLPFKISNSIPNSLLLNAPVLWGEVKFNKDLLFLEIIDNNKKLTQFGKELIQLKDPDEVKSVLKKKCLGYKKFKALKKALDSNPKIKAKELVEQLGRSFFDGKELSSKVIYATKAISWIK